MKFRHWLAQGLWVQIVALDVFEVAIGAYLEFVAGILVGDYHGMAVHLQRTECAHMIYSTLDGLLQCAGLVVAIDDNHHAASRHHCAYTNGECGLGHLVDVAVKETTVGDDGVLCQCLLAGERGQR